jgi:hypothetical protein
MDPPEHIASREEKTHRNLVVTDREQSKKRGSRARNELSSDLLSLQFEGHREHPISPRNRPFSALIPDLGNRPNIALESFGNSPRFHAILLYG